MENLACLWVNLLLCSSWLGIFLPSSLAFPAQQDTLEHGTKGYEERRPAVEMRTVSVICHPDFMEIVVKADMFEVGTSIKGEELRLGVDYRDSCRATASSPDEFTIAVGLSDCGNKHWMMDDSLIYTNLLIYSPMVSEDGLIRMDEALIPIECHYGRKYSLSSSSLRPTWIPFTSTEAAVETLDFDMRIMTNDWMYERGSRVFYLGEPINIEASVKVGHHMGFRMFVSSCVATLDPDTDSIPRYVFIDNGGCLVDSQLEDSHSHFVPRIQDDKLQFTIDAFRFHREDRGELYVTCRIAAVPVTNHADPQNKACTFINGRWRSADGSDYLCSFCQGQNADLAPFDSQPGPRGYGKPGVSDNFWSGTMDNVLEQDSSLGPMLVLPSRYKSGPLPPEDLPPLLSKISPSYGSKWRSGVHVKIGHYPPDEEDEESDEEEGFSEKDLAKGLVPGPLLIPTPQPAGLTTEALVQTSSRTEEDKGARLKIDPGKWGTTLKDLDGKGVVGDKDVAARTNGSLGITHDQETQEAKVHTTARPNNATAAPGDATAAPSEAAVHADSREVERTTLASSPATDSDLSDKVNPKK